MKKYLRDILFLLFSSLAAPVLFIVPIMFMVVIGFVNKRSMFKLDDLSELGFIFLIAWLVSLVASMTIGLSVVLIFNRLSIFSFGAYSLIGFVFGALIFAVIGLDSITTGSSGSGYSANGVDYRIDGVPTNAAWIEYIKNMIWSGVLAMSVAAVFWITRKNYYERDASVDV